MASVSKCLNDTSNVTYYVEVEDKRLLKNLKTFYLFVLNVEKLFGLILKNIIFVQNVDSLLTDKNIK